MKNITLAIDENVLQRVRIVAAQRKTTVNALVRKHLASLAASSDRLAKVKQELRELSEQTSVRLGPNYRFNREDAYAERGVFGHERPDLRGSRKNRRAS